MSSTPSLFERLYTDHKRVEEVLEQKRQELKAAELKGCTFKPKTNTISRRRSGGDPEVRATLTRRCCAFCVVVAIDVVVSFVVMLMMLLVMLSRALGSQVWNRLYAESQTNADVHKLWAELKKREEVEGCTFKPAVSVQP